MMKTLIKRSRRRKTAEPERSLSRAEWFALAHDDFWAFVNLAFPVLHPGQELEFAPYLEFLADILMSVEKGKRRRVIFNLPPRYMKSMMVSVLYTAWRLGRNPAAKFICISYGDDLAHNLSVMTRKLMMSPLYEAIFPHTILDKKAQDYIVTTKGGYRYATSVGSDITGFGTDEIIIDDPMQPDHATSEREKERIRSWVAGSVLTRFNDQRHGALMLVMHRLAPDDLSATLAASGAYDVFSLPLIAERDEAFEKPFFKRRPGETLNPARMTEEEAAELRAGMPAHVFASQYQQRPTVGGSGMLSYEHLRWYNAEELPEFKQIIHSWDLGGTVNGNPSVCTVWAVVEVEGEDTLFLIDLILVRAELPEAQQCIRTLNERDQPALIILDNRGIGLGVIQQLEREGYRHLTGVTSSERLELPEDDGHRPNCSKVEMFGRASLEIAAGRVFFPDKAPWLEGFLRELLAFPNIRDKDQVDSMTQLVAFMDQAIFRARNYHRSRQFERERATRAPKTMRKGPPRRVTLRPDRDLRP